MPHGLGVSVHAHAVLASNRDAKLEGVDRIQAEPIAEERRFAIDLIDSDVFQIQDLDQQVLELLFQGIHSARISLRRAQFGGLWTGTAAVTYHRVPRGTRLESTLQLLAARAARVHIQPCPSAVACNEASLESNQVRNNGVNGRESSSLT